MPRPPRRPPKQQTQQATEEKPVIKPQPGPQEAFLSSSADIVIFGGAAGGGKSWCLLAEALRNIGNPQFGAVIFRRTYPQITNKGGLWDEATAMYAPLGPTPLQTTLKFIFPSGATISFAHMQHEKDKDNYIGSQIPLIGWDEVTQFSEEQFWFLMSRNRSTCGVAPYVRATCNPDSESWVAKLIEWWIDQDTGYAIPERSGVIRWIIRDNDENHWFDDRESAVRYAESLISEDDPKREMLLAEAPSRPKSFTFIPSYLENNQILMRKDPGYLSNLMAQTVVDRERLLRGNWKIKPVAGLMFPNNKWKFASSLPEGKYRFCRFWDKAGTEGGSGARTAGVLMAAKYELYERIKMWMFFVVHVAAGRWSDLEVEEKILFYAHADREKYGNVKIGMEQEPGSSGKFAARFTIRALAGFDVFSEHATGSKADRWKPFAVQQQAGNVTIVQDGTWDWLGYVTELDNLAGDDVADKHALKDRADASAGAFKRLAFGETTLYASPLVIDLSKPAKQKEIEIETESPQQRFARERRELMEELAARMDGESF